MIATLTEKPVTKSVTLLEKNRAARPVGWAFAEAVVGAAVVPVVERLENRWLMAGNPAAVQTVPFSLAFDGNGGGLADATGIATGFTYVQPNVSGNEYQASLLNVNASAGTLQITTAGNANAGGNWEGDNTLVDGLQNSFNGSAGAFTVSTRLIGPLGNLSAPNEQGGLLFGPDDDNYVKFVAVSTPNGQLLQFADEQKTSTGYSHAINPNNSYTNAGNFSSINTLDLEIAANADTGVITGFYRVNGGPLQQVGQSVTLSGAEKSAFFNSTTRAGVMAMAKNNLSPVTVTFQNFAVAQGTPAPSRPTVVAAHPGQGNTNVSRNAFVNCDLSLPFVGEGVDPATLNHTTVYLVRTADNKLVPAVLNTDGAGGTIILQPNSPLDANTQYSFFVNSGVKDTGGHAFVPFSTTFTTGTQIVKTNPSIAFQKVTLPTAANQVYTGVTMGPDGMLYACTYDGLIQRFAINADGTLGTPTNITTVQTANNGNRTITGMAFDPASTAGNPILWISNNAYAPDIAGETNAPDFSSKISVLSGVDLQNYQDAIVGLPRSVRDHVTEQPVFGPDGALYFCQPSNSSMGAPDSQWGMRGEHLLNAAILRLDVKSIDQRLNSGQGALNVQTTDAGGSYNPYAQGAPLTIYATGVRNAYDLVWAANGHLYAPTNGASYGGATPSAPSGVPVVSPNTADPQTVQGIPTVTQTEDDFLFDVQAGGYYGHPNPTRGQYVLDGGNPTTVPASFGNSQEFSQYPVGTNPDPDYQDPAYNFGAHYSPNGVLQYQGNAFGGALDGALMVVRYSGGKDVEILGLDSSGNVTGVQTGNAGLSGFVNPLDLTEDNATGNIYVADYGAHTLTLLRPIGPGAQASVSTTAVYYKDAPGGAASAVQNVTITNTGTVPLAFPADGLVINGSDATLFLLANEPALPTTVAPGASITVGISFIPQSSTSVGVHTAVLQFKTNDANNALISVNLFGLATGPSVTPIPAPAGLTAAGSAQGSPDAVTLSWSPVTAGNLAGYNVYSSTSASGPFTKLNASGLLPAAQTRFTDTNAAAGVTTYYQVAAVDTSGNVSAFATASGTPGSTTAAPAAPTGLTATPITSGIALSWTASPSADLLGYNVYSGASANGPFTLLTTAGPLPASQTHYTDGSASGGTTYYQVVAVDNSGNASAPATARASLPAPVTNLGAVGSASGVSLTWTASVTGSVVGYNIYRASSANGAFTLLNADGPWASTSFNDAGAPAGSASYYRVIAVDGSGNPSAAATAHAVVPFPAPTTPANLAATASLGGGVTLTWSAVAVGDLAGYNVYRSTSTNGVFVLLNTKGPLSSPRYVDVSASAGATWYYQVTAVDTQGRASSAASASAAVSFAPPAAPAGLSTTGTDAGIMLSWTSNAEGDLLGYNVFRSLSTTGGFTLLNTGGPITSPQYQDASAAAGRAWYYQVLAIDTQGRTSAPAATAGYRAYNATPPASPAGVTASGAPGLVTLKWSANGELDLLGYQVFRAASPNGPYVQVNGGVQQGTTIVDAKAPVGVVSYYKVCAVNTSGVVSAAASAGATAARDMLAPALPPGLTAAGTVSGITLSWGAVATADLAGYNVYRCYTPHGRYVKLNAGPLGSPSFLDASAKVKVKVYYQVRAVNTSGVESASVKASATRPLPPKPPKPPKVKAAAKHHG